MPRNLVICFDGTNCKFGRENTNVVRLIQVLDRNPELQRLYYDPGVGTLPEPGAWSALNKWLSQIAGLAFGAGLESKAEEAYSYLMDFWEPLRGPTRSMNHSSVGGGSRSSFRSLSGGKIHRRDSIVRPESETLNPRETLNIRGHWRSAWVDIVKSRLGL